MWLNQLGPIMMIFRITWRKYHFSEGIGQRKIVRKTEMTNNARNMEDKYVKATRGISHGTANNILEPDRLVGP